VGDLCGICTDLVGSDDLALAKCGHVFHHECIGSFVEEVSARKQKPTCPTCHKPLTVTMQLHDGSDMTLKDEAQIKRQLTGIFKDKDTTAAHNCSDEDGQPPQKANAKRQKTTHAAVHRDDNDEQEESSDEESELARALAMSMCKDDGNCEDEPSDEPDEDMQNAGNEDEIDNEQLGLLVSSQNDAHDTVDNKNPRGTQAKQQSKRGHKEGGVSVGRSNFMSRMDVAQFKPSSKLTAVVDAIVQVKEKSGGKGKSIVFSQFVNMLDLVEWQLRKTGMSPVKLVGSMPPAQRASVLAAFKTNPKVDTILLSLRAGGEGLNLQCATHVFLLDPW
jgi:DNA repair protein RAD16